MGASLWFSTMGVAVPLVFGDGCGVSLSLVLGEGYGVSLVIPGWGGRRDP
jgi:hypothetical protein